MGGRGDRKGGCLTIRQPLVAFLFTHDHYIMDNRRFYNRGRLPLRLRWTGRSPGRMRGKNPLLGEGGSAKRRRVWGGTNSDLCRLLFRPGGAYRSSGVTVAVRLYPLIRHGLCPCHLPRGGRRPPAGDKTLSWERVARRSRDGCGAVQTWTRCRPSSGPEGPPSPRGRLEGFSSKNFKIYVDILGIQW